MTLTDEELEALERRYSPTDPGPCRVCGEALEIQALGPGSYVAWAHSAPSGISILEWSDHYAQSRVESYKPSDSDVLALVREVRELRGVGITEAMNPTRDEAEVERLRYLTTPQWSRGKQTPIDTDPMNGPV